MKNTVTAAIQELDEQVKQNLLVSAAEGATYLDTSLKWSPLILVLLSDVFGLATKHTFKHRVLRILVGEAVLNAIMLPLKRAVDRKRPNGARRSLPSGHAATSFLSSEILYEELKESSPVLSHTGYTLSCATCFLRLYHNKHWLSDVAAGALLGVASAKISTKLVRKIENKQKNSYLKPENLLM